MNRSKKIFPITLAATTFAASLIISKNISIQYNIYSTDIYARNISTSTQGDARKNINRPKRSIRNVIEGYTNKEAYSIGETIHFHVSTSEPSYSISIRLDRRPPGSNLITSEKLVGKFHQVPTNGWLGANWPTSWSFTIPES